MRVACAPRRVWLNPIFSNEENDQVHTALCADRSSCLQRVVSVDDDEESMSVVDPTAFAAALALERDGREQVLSFGVGVVVVDDSMHT